MPLLSKIQNEISASSMGAFAPKGELVYVSKNDSEQNRSFLEFCL